MRLLIVSALSLTVLLPFASTALAQEAKPSVDIRTEYLMTIEAKLGSRVPVGQRVIVSVLGGTVRGPRAKGEIVAPAGDWVSSGCLTDSTSVLPSRPMTVNSCSWSIVVSPRQRKTRRTC